MPTFINLSWTQIENDAHALADKLLQSQLKWDGIIAIARGGLVPATILSHRLNIHWLDTLCLSSYNDVTKKQGALRILKEFKSDSDKLLVVDDLVDTGETFLKVREMLPKAHFSCLYAKKPGISTVDTYTLKVPSDSWLVFPWEESDA